MIIGANATLRILTQFCNSLLQLCHAIFVRDDLLVKHREIGHHLLQFLGMFSQISYDGQGVRARLTSDSHCGIFEEWNLNVFHIGRQWVWKFLCFEGCAQVEYTPDVVFLAKGSTFLWLEDAQFSTTQKQATRHLALAISKGNATQVTEI